MLQATAFGLRSVVGAQDLTPKQLMTLIEFCEKSSMVRGGVACADMLGPSSVVPCSNHASSLLLDEESLSYAPYGTSEKYSHGRYCGNILVNSLSSQCIQQQERPLITVRLCTI